MISVAEAKKIIAATDFSRIVLSLPLEETAQMRLAKDVFSPVDVPAFAQSSMDGYAFAYADWQTKKKLLIEGEMQAGSKTNFLLHSGQAVRIFTGAPLPGGADTVIMQEKTTIADNQLHIDEQNLQKGNSVRLQGSGIKKNELALEKNSLLSPAALGFLANLGISHVPVFAKPAISIIVTGKELQQPGNVLQYGEVYESNSFALKAALLQQQINDVKVYNADDEPEILIQVLQEALACSDMVLLTGGVSVGDYDFVVPAAEACGVTKLFHKVKQRPGKPLYFGKKENKLIFGLPGNPSSVLTCFYEYVLPALNTGLITIQVPFANTFQKPAGLTHFLKGLYNGKTVLALDAQESYRMSSFAKANCLIKVEEEITFCKEGEMTEIHLLPL